MVTRAQQNVFPTETVGKTLIITPQGDASGFRYHQVHAETNRLIELLNGDQIQHLVIDFGAVEIVGSIIISSIIKLARKVNARDGHAAFCCVSPTMLDVVQSMNLTRLWPCFESRDDAIASFES